MTGAEEREASPAIGVCSTLTSMAQTGGMTSLALDQARGPFSLSLRWRSCGLGAALAAAALALGVRISPAGAYLGPSLIAAAIGAAVIVHAWTAADDDIRKLDRALMVGIVVVIGAFASGLSGAALEPAFGFASLALLAGCAYRSQAANRVATFKVQWTALLAFAALIGVLFAYNAWYVIASRDLEIADFMFFRLVSVAVASLLDTGRVAPLIVQLCASLKADYSWVAGLLPGAVLAATAPLSRAVYQASLMAFYAAPALVALGWLARELARRAGANVPRSLATLALAVAAVAVVYPTGLAVTARGMPDVGGLALFVYALRTGDKLARAAALPRAGALTRRLALTLALTLFALFIFRRWYVFGALGVLGAVALELVILAAPRLRTFAWAPLFSAGAFAALVGVVLLSPILVDWAGEPAKHDYGNLYAAYRKSNDVFLGLIGDWWGFGVLALIGVAFAVLLARSPNARLARMTLLSCGVAAVLFLRIQTPYVHHVFLIAPSAAALAAGLLIIASHSRGWGLAALAALAAVTLTPAGALAPKGVFPTYARPHAPRQDLAELARMKDWVDAHASPERKVCGLGSSYTFSGQLIDELWQLKADKSPLHLEKGQRTSVLMSDVDTVEGPPTSDLKDCAFMLVGDPVQTHLIPAYQQTVILPSLEMLEGTGIGAHYARTGETFHLENGVSVVVFERASALTDEDMAALAERWRAARAEPPRP